MARYLITFLFFQLVCSTGVFGQWAGGVTTSFESYPTVKLRFQLRDPEFRLKWLVNENGKPVDSVEVDVKPVTRMTRARILVLLENRGTRDFAAQRMYFRKLLSGLMSHPSADSVEWHFAPFDWTDKSGKAVPSQKVRTGTPKQMINYLNRLSNLENQLAGPVTELNTAVVDGLKYLSQFPADSSKVNALLVLSGEVHNFLNPNISQRDLIEEGRRQDIAVFSVRYPRVVEKYNLKRLCEETYGVHLMAKPSAPRSTLDSLVKTVRKVTVRAAGTTYEVSYTTAGKLGGETLVVNLSEGKGPVLATLSLQTPGWLQWIGFSWLRIMIVTMVMVLLATLSIGWIRKVRRKSAEQIDQRMSGHELKIKESDAELERIRAGQQQMAREQDRQLHQQQSDQRFRSRKQIPVLIASNGANYHLTKTDVTIGREPGCDIVISESSVSRKHCRVFFERQNPEMNPVPDGRFYIINLSGTNPTVVSNHSVDKATPLENGSVILLGNIRLTFRC